MLRKILMAAAISLVLPFAHAEADPACSGACASLVGEGRVLAVQGKLQEAMAKFKAASAAAPKASAPLSAAAHAYLLIVDAVKPEQAPAVRKQAEGLARAALQLAADDPLAQEVLRMLADATPSPLRLPSQAAAAPLGAAEQLFAQRKFAAALEKYEQAMKLDPQYSGAWVGAGDCWYMQHDWARAEAMFRRATGIEPRNGQAWRFLSDALYEQGKPAAAEDALLSGIAADPAQLPSWNKLAGLRARAGKPLKPLALRRGARVGAGADGKTTISIDGDLQKSSSTPDNAIRLALAMAEANARKPADGARSSPFEVELQAWRMALKVADETAARGAAPMSDPALLAMQGLARDGQLEPAIFVLLYKEAHRPDYERWLAAHPDGVKAFIERYGLRP
ncbi:Beta-barrel assembly-enhancing protease [Massilia sp. Bi118]|uniref:tetratricopeptide repeat protein n=1 Tax=Massilia sp. Bi118 TaxID=2822346 RepID=UPI001D95EF33|nr:tetratricopeptide repeat protein [Massilia sp. Bi118]CAH0312188.1 Beta-barrel assembly-enhancing protease [Massilia sp. Bi118]